MTMFQKKANFFIGKHKHKRFEHDLRLGITTSLVITKCVVKFMKIKKKGVI